MVKFTSVADALEDADKRRAKGAKNEERMVIESAWRCRGPTTGPKIGGEWGV